MKRNSAVHKHLGLLVAEKRCNECLYSKNRIVSDDRAEEIQKKCQSDGSYFICHKSTLANQNVVCRGFFDEARNQTCQIAQRLGLVTFVDPGKRIDPDATEIESSK